MVVGSTIAVPSDGDTSLGAKTLSDCLSRLYAVFLMRSKRSTASRATRSGPIAVRDERGTTGSLLASQFHRLRRILMRLYFRARTHAPASSLRPSVPARSRTDAPVSVGVAYIIIRYSRHQSRSPAWGQSQPRAARDRSDAKTSR